MEWIDRHLVAHHAMQTTANKMHVIKIILLPIPDFLCSHIKQPFHSFKERKKAALIFLNYINLLTTQCRMSQRSKEVSELKSKHQLNPLSHISGMPTCDRDTQTQAIAYTLLASHKNCIFLNVTVKKPQLIRQNGSLPTLKKPTTKTSSFSVIVFNISTLSTGMAAGPVRFFSQFTISDDVRPPLYSDGLPLRKNFSVGYPLTSNFSLRDVSSVASTLARRIGDDSSFNALAAFAYSGAKALQCPHQGASVSTYARYYSNIIVSTI